MKIKEFPKKMLDNEMIVCYNDDVKYIDQHILCTSRGDPLAAGFLLGEKNAVTHTLSRGDIPLPWRG